MLARTTKLHETSNLGISSSFKGAVAPLWKAFFTSDQGQIAVNRRIWMITIALTTMITLRCRSEEHTSELQSLMRISYAVFCLKKNKTPSKNDNSARTLLNITKNTDNY